MGQKGANSPYYYIILISTLSYLIIVMKLVVWWWGAYWYKSVKHRSSRILDLTRCKSDYDCLPTHNLHHTGTLLGNQTETNHCHGIHSRCHQGPYRTQRMLRIEREKRGVVNDILAGVDIFASIKFVLEILFKVIMKNKKKCNLLITTKSSIH